ncbi:MAG: DUF2335 domain-containing protein [Vicinamibacterales bacterium]|nr:DUF2335 domain-containing protein [Vicinamibacterales bacterium]
MADPNALDTRQSQAPARRVSASISAFQGPLPPPEMLERYNAIVPNGADRIVAMAEGQLRHRQQLESMVVNGNVTSQKRGQLFAFVLGLVAIVGGIVLIGLDKDTQGLAAIITAFVALAGVFVYGRWEQERERERKRREAREAAENPRLPFESN